MLQKRKGCIETFILIGVEVGEMLYDVCKRMAMWVKDQLESIWVKKIESVRRTYILKNLLVWTLEKFVFDRWSVLFVACSLMRYNFTLCKNIVFFIYIHIKFGKFCIISDLKFYLNLMYILFWFSLVKMYILSIFIFYYYYLKTMNIITYNNLFCNLCDAYGNKKCIYMLHYHLK